MQSIHYIELTGKVLHLKQLGPAATLGFFVLFLF